MADDERWVAQLRRDLGTLGRQQQRGETLSIARRPPAAAPAGRGARTGAAACAAARRRASAGGRRALDGSSSGTGRSLPGPVADRLNAVDRLVEVDVGDIRIRGMRPETEVVVQQGDQLTSVSVRAPQR